ncbi:TM2 domain-containing protein [Saprospira sp. CCB-QB6]|uniref:TM2 domain-containing protein n=1 Tax=Saprospira sp. CCB-QB6 TaxID=3023936 RepID=UPI00234A3824|nr:TM2 domain-containing protein [Saprospira sp. CCB-QB6]WCL81183.1 TM2 domain-containing protein [Saprospira sp. CCB-QB6]
MKSKLIAAVLAITLGFLGAHKFYLGRTKQAVLYMTLFWTTIPALLALVDFFVLIFMSDDLFEQTYMPEFYRTKIEALRRENDKNKKENEKMRREVHAASIENQYQEKYAQAIADEKVWIGMNKEMLIAAFGYPEKEKKHLTKEGTNERYYYGEYPHPQGHRAYRLEVQLENEEVIGIKEL